ncbi:MAG TPA: hypothetical protein VGJ70_17115 [Solirubrobacteraceae bacterium]
MPSPVLRPRNLAFFAVGLIAGAVDSATAYAAGAECRASVARLVALSPVASEVEPVRANDRQAPCTRQSSVAVSSTTIGPVEVQKATAATDVTEGPTIGSMAQASRAAVRLPGLTVDAEGLKSVSLARCAQGATALEGYSSVATLRINGQEVALPPGGKPLTTGVGLVGTVRVNDVVERDGTVARRALVVETPSAQAVLAEAVAGGDACAATDASATAEDAARRAAEGSEGSHSAARICPSGATYDPDRGACVIPAHSDQNTTDGDVVVGRAFDGPSGGRVVELSTARRQIDGRCLTGPGPAFAIVGTGGRDLVTGTNRRDRIVVGGGNDQVSTGRGDDCVDGGAGRDVLSGALGDDRLVGGAGNDALDGGSGADRLLGGSGGDTINAGYGRDRVNGGAGSDAINTAVAGPAARSITCGGGRDKVRINRNERRRVRGCEVVYRVR